VTSLYESVGQLIFIVLKTTFELRLLFFPRSPWMHALVWSIV